MHGLLTGKYDCSIRGPPAWAYRQESRVTTNFSQTAAYIWSLADLLRGDFKQSQYGRVILPFTILRRLECVLEKTGSSWKRVGDLSELKSL
jgi:type I restriction-modification system DNA methylase subunit